MVGKAISRGIGGGGRCPCATVGAVKPEAPGNRAKVID
jgi:hypothetical protein